MGVAMMFGFKGFDLAIFGVGLATITACLALALR
jgi:hypothetical protein